MRDFEVIQGFIDGIRPEQPLELWEWADKYRYLSQVAAAEAGQYRTSRTPYLKEIMSKLSSFDETERVVFMKSAQIGATEAANNFIGYVIDVSPAPCLMVMPTESSVKRNSKTRIDPMIEATPRLREKIGPAKSRDSDNTIFQKSFPGGVLIMTGANSGSALRSMPIRFLILDEVDAYPMDVDEEGSPLDLAIARTRTFARRKIYMCSTPTVDGQSVIQSEFLKTDQRYYYVPCPHCGVFQILKFERMRWEKGDPDTAAYQCEHCEGMIEERHKTAMLLAGEWKATQPDNANPKRVGYHLNALYSPMGWYSWADAVAQFEDAENDTPKLKAFVNTVLGETWKEKGDAPAWENLYNRRESYQVNKPPRDVAFLTAGVDVQKDRLEIEITGWCKGKRSYSIDYRVLLGDTSQKHVWDQLAQIVGEQWEAEDGRLMNLRLMAVDTGYNTTHVYNFCRRFDYTRVIPIKGKDQQATIVAPPRAVDTSRRGKKIEGLKVWNLGVSIIKSELYGWLRIERGEGEEVPAGYCHFPQYDHHYFKGLTAEQLEFKIIRGFRKYEWVKKFERNEPLDCRVYARAAAYVVGMDRFKDEHWIKISQGYGQRQDQVVRQADRRERRRRGSGDSSFWR